MKKVAADILKLKTQLLQKIKQKKAILTSNMESNGIPLLDAELLLEESDSIMKLVQAEHFKDELGKLKQKERTLSKYHTKIQGFLQNNSAAWIKWKRNPPAASDIGGIWEHQIRSARDMGV